MRPIHRDIARRHNKRNAFCQDTSELQPTLKSNTIRCVWALEYLLDCDSPAVATVTEYRDRIEEDDGENQLTYTSLCHLSGASTALLD